MNHILGNVGHNLTGLLNSFGGNQFNAYNSIVNAAQRMVDLNKLTGVFHSVNNLLIVKGGV